MEEKERCRLINNRLFGQILFYSTDVGEWGHLTLESRNLTTEYTSTGRERTSSCGDN